MLNNKNVSRALTMSLAVLLSLSTLVGCGSDSILSPLNPTIHPNNPRNPLGQGPAPVSLSPNGGSVTPGDLSAAGSYVIMAKTGITNVTGSSIVGNLAVSPADHTYLTGFGESQDLATKQFSTAPAVNGRIYTADYSPPTPSNLTVAIGNMETAYTDGAGRSNPDYTELYTGNLGGQTLMPGLYKWGNNVIIPNSFYIFGGPNDVFIFQIAGNVSMDASMSIILQGGAQAKNIFWIVAGEVTIQANSHFEGTILSKTAVTLQTQASLNGRIYAQSLVSLDNNAVTQK